MADGQARPRATQHARRAVSAYDLGHYQEALEEFERAYSLYPTDNLLFNIAQTHRRLEHCEQAVERYRLLLDRYPDFEEAAGAVRRPAVRCAMRPM